MILHKLLFFKLPYQWVILIGFSVLWGVGIDKAYMKQVCSGGRHEWGSHYGWLKG